MHEDLQEARILASCAAGPRTVAEMLWQSKATPHSSRFSLLLKMLRKKGYLRRQKDPSNKRFVLNSLTETGQKRLADLLVKIQQDIEEIERFIEEARSL